MFHDERAAMCYGAGRLIGVRYGVPDGLTAIEAIILDFEAGSWVLAVNSDDDTARIAHADAQAGCLEDVHIGPAPDESPWATALGSVAQWVWILENQQGYHDGIQFCFAIDGKEVCQIQLMAAASSWRISMLHR